MPGQYAGQFDGSVMYAKPSADGHAEAVLLFHSNQAHAFSFSRRSSDTTRGFAFPPVSFMT